MKSQETLSYETSQSFLLSVLVSLVRNAYEGEKTTRNQKVRGVLSIELEGFKFYFVAGKVL